MKKLSMQIVRVTAIGAGPMEVIIVPTMDDITPIATPTIKGSILHSVTKGTSPFEVATQISPIVVEIVGTIHQHLLIQVEISGV